MGGGRRPDPFIWRHFTKSTDPSTGSSSSSCNHCSYKRSTISVARLHKHLLTCSRYVREDDDQLILRPPRTMEFGQFDDVTRLFVLAIAESGLSLRTFDNPCWKEFFTMINRSWIQPNRNTITTWIPTIYQDVYKELTTLLEFKNLINITADESSDVSHHRIANMCIHLPEGSFHWSSQDLGSISATADVLSQWIGEEANNVCNEDFKKLNSFCFDTNSTMRAVSQNLSEDPRFARCFYVLCGSHGLQLLVKDIIKLSPLDKYLQEAQLL